MKAIDYKSIPLRPVDLAGVKGVKIRWLISQKEAPNFVMRMYEVEPGGYTPHHTHPFEHEVFVLDGQGEVVCEGETKPLTNGCVVYMPQDKKHQFRNTGDKILRFLCLIPAQTP